MEPIITILIALGITSTATVMAVRTPDTEVNPSTYSATVTAKNDKRCKMKSFNAIATAAFVGASLLTAQPALAACSSREVSYTSRVSVQFSVTNNRRYPVNVVWIDFEGIRKHYRTLRSGDTFSSSSYLSHVWIMEEASSNLCLSNIRLGAANQHLILR